MKPQTDKTRAVTPTAEIQIPAGPGLSGVIAQGLRRCALEFDCTAIVEDAGGRTANARDLLALLMLGAGPGEPLRVRCTGPQAHGAAEAIATLLSAPMGGIP